MAHDVMKAVPVGNARPRFDHTLPPRLGSVLILFYEDDGNIYFPLIKRPEYNGTHSGQVSLPGGKTEPGESYIETALRETFEEIGVGSEGVKIMGRLSEFHVLPSNYLITPVIATISSIPSFVPDPFEVARVIRASLDDLLDEKASKQKQITVAGIYTLDAPHFEIEQEIVWGATAMILNELREILK